MLSSDRTLDILKIGVGTHNWMCVRKKDFHVSCTWYKSLFSHILCNYFCGFFLTPSLRNTWMFPLILWRPLKCLLHFRTFSNLICMENFITLKLLVLWTKKKLYLSCKKVKIIFHRNEGSACITYYINVSYPLLV